MKCIVVAVMVALAVAAEGSAIASYAVPLAYSVPQTTVVQQNVAPKYVVSDYHTAYVDTPHVDAHYHGAHAYAHVPAVSYASTAVHPVAYAAPHAHVHTVAAHHQVHHEARYLAANRGAVHEAPLPGHAVNQQTLNLEAAPGTH
ncbi:adult cuticle protein 1-like [Anopheles cruzii]|uniref:adult cuticle protein 1-like n=1 Tax=Anopheles cruzii TaxID=68878 RepID=UPI0022EC4E62|nr:adult cuticle protein 1-like [Anopheles cruzii]